MFSLSWLLPNLLSLSSQVSKFLPLPSPTTYLSFSSHGVSFPQLWVLHDSSITLPISWTSPVHCLHPVSLPFNPSAWIRSLLLWKLAHFVYFFIFCVLSPAAAWWILILCIKLHYSFHSLSYFSLCITYTFLPSFLCLVQECHLESICLYGSLSFLHRCL